MLFNSWLFVLVYAPIVMGGAYALRRLAGPGPTIAWLGAASLVFYTTASLEHLPLLIGSIVVNQWVASRIAETRGQAAERRPWLVLGLALNLSLLLAFKYSGFVATVLNQALGTSLLVPEIALPVGISFFTFTQVAYLVDVYKRACEPHSGPPYLLFVSYFPHLVAGPVLRHDDTIRQFSGQRFARFMPLDVERGLVLFAIGLAKKVLIADSLAPYADACFKAADQGVLLSIWEAWLGLLSYTFQIYFDFSGYSDMALGLSLMLGIDIPVNFRSPYRATSIIEFWRRWHISLSNFLRDYLYIPLGGNRLGKVRRNLNLFATMLLGGLWHGAGWGFVAWGALHGLYLVVNHLWREHVRLRMPRVLGATLTFASVAFAWSFFRASTLEGALNMIGSAFGANGVALPQSQGTMAALLQHWVPWVHWSTSGMLANDLTTTKLAWAATVVLAALLAWGAPNSTALSQADTHHPADLRKRTLCAAGVLMAIAATALGRESPFLYFQF